MIVILGAALAALYGGRTARKRGGKGLDVAQYATVYAIIGALAGLVITLMLDRFVV